MPPGPSRLETLVRGGVQVAARRVGRSLTDVLTTLEPAIPGQSTADQADRGGPMTLRQGSILRGTVARSVAGAVLVEVGGGLPVRVPVRGRPPTAGQALLIQITREADPDGPLAKGPEGTTDLVLPGRYVLHRPFGRGISVSKALPPEAAAQIRPILEGRPGGWILRRHAASAATEDVQGEADTLVQDGRSLADHPDRALAGPDAVQRVLLDFPDVTEVLVDGSAEARRLETWITARLAGERPRVTLATTDLADELSGVVLDPIVPLAGGGRLIVEPTSALVAVDVDVAGGPGAAAVALAAARELPRHLRLRNLSGIVVLDLPKLDRKAELEPILQALRSGLEDDPVATSLSPRISPLGLVEMSRQRRYRPVGEDLRRALDQAT